MTEQKQRERWLQDVQDRQKNIVFPQTVENESRLWRNIATRPPTKLTWVGLSILGLFVFGIAAITLAIIGRLAWVVALGTLLIFGPIFLVIGWATRRNLRKVEPSRHRH